MRWGLASLMVGTVLLSVDEAAAREGKFFAAQINYLVSGLDGTGRVDGDASPGTTFDVQDTLGITDDDKLPAADLWFSFGRSSFLLSYLGTAYDGTAVLPADLVFEDTTFPSGTPIQSELDLKLAKLHYNFRFVDSAVVDFGLLVGADLLSADGRVVSPAGLQAASDFSSPFPVLGLNVAVKVPATGLVVYVEGSGMKLNAFDIDGTVLDAQARLTWYVLSGPFGLSVGYRLFQIDADVVDEGSADLQQTAYFGGLSVRF